MKPHSIYELADRYKSGQLSAEEQQSVDSRLQNDPQFAKIFSEYLAANEAIRQAARAEQKEKFKALFLSGESTLASTPLSQPRVENRQTGRSRSQTIIRYLSAAAAVFAFCFIGYWIWAPPSSSNALAQATEEIYQERVYGKTRMSDEKFVQLFQDEKYFEALTLLQKEAQIHETNPESVLPTDLPLILERQGFCYWKLEQWEAALAPFQKLAERTVLKPEFNPARYYLALTYLELGEQEKGEELLLQLAEESGHSYSDRAKSLLEEK